MVRKNEREKWQKYTEDLIDAIDIEAECKEWGLEFTGTVSSQGFAECRAVDRADRKPSAAVNLQTGYYKDLGPGASMPFFRFAVEYGPYSNFFDAQRQLAKKYKVKAPVSTAGRSFWSTIREKKWVPVSTSGLCKEVGVTPETLQLVGGSLALNTLDQVVVVFPVYDMIGPFERPQSGIVMMNSAGGKVRKYSGPGAPIDLLRTHSMGTSGIMNRHAMTHWADAQTIYKVEGVSDMLRLQEMIPEKFRNKHLVVTNSAGCDAAQDAHRFPDLARGKTVVIIHDADEPGQFGSGTDKTGGATRWFNALNGRAGAVINFQLYDTLETKKGKDLRDWFDEGNTYEDLTRLINERKDDFHLAGQSTKAGTIVVPETMDQNLSEHQLILRSLDLTVLGHLKNGGCVVFNMASCTRFVIPDINRFTFEKQLIHIGEAAVRHVADPNDDDAPEEMLDFRDVRKAVAREAGKNEISRTNTLGIGIWESGGRIFAIGSGEWLSVNGGIETYKSPMVDEKIIDFGEKADEWYDPDLLYGYLEQARSTQYCEEVYNELATLLNQWNNHTHPLAGETMASLVIATFSQSIWRWRPWVAVTGESATGKTLLFNLISDLFGPLCVATSNASEAGIRNKVGTTSRVLMLDEFESSPHRTAILDTLMATNRRGNFGASLRSNAAQDSVTSEYQLLPWFSATEMKKDKQTEANRYLTFELRGKPSWIDPKKLEDATYINELRNKLIAVSMRIALPALDLIAYIHQETAEDYTRQGDSYALCSGIYSAIHGFEQERAVQFFRSMMLQLRSSEIIEDEEPEQDRALMSILSSQVRFGMREVSVITLLQEERAGNFSEDPESILRELGIKRLPWEDVRKMVDYKRQPKDAVVANSSYVFFNTSESGQIRRRLLKGTQHDRKDLRTLLSRLPGAVATLMKIGTNSRGVMIPLGLVHGVESKPWPEVTGGEDLLKDPDVEGV